MATTNKIDHRVTVQFGKDNKTIPIFILVKESTAKYFGFPIKNEIYTRTVGKKRIARRGSVGSKSIRIPTEKTKTYTRKGKSVTVTLYKSIPVPSEANIQTIGAFLKANAKTHKPKFFISPNGRSYPI
jgi:hypothetical protein